MVFWSTFCSPSFHFGKMLELELNDVKKIFMYIIIATYAKPKKKKKKWNLPYLDQ